MFIFHVHVCMYVCMYMNISEEPRGGPEYPCSDHGTCSKAQELVGDLHMYG